MTLRVEVPRDWVSPEAMLAPDLHLVVGACRGRRFRRRWVAALRRGDDLILSGDAGHSIDDAIDRLRADYLRRVREGWRP